MKIEVLREACCSQDDQTGPLTEIFELPEGCRLDEFLTIVMRSGFLQFSSTHIEMSCRIKGQEVARVFSPYETPKRMAEFVFQPDSLLENIAARGDIDFVFNRN